MLKTKGRSVKFVVMTYGRSISELPALPDDVVLLHGASHRDSPDTEVAGYYPIAIGEGRHEELKIPWSR